MAEVSRVNARLYPSSDAISHGQGNGARMTDGADEKGIVARVGTWPLGLGLNARDARKGIEVEDVGGRVEWPVLTDEGRGNAVCEIWFWVR